MVYCWYQQVWHRRACELCLRGGIRSVVLVFHNLPMSARTGFRAGEVWRQVIVTNLQLAEAGLNPIQTPSIYVYRILPDGESPPGYQACAPSQSDEEVQDCLHRA